jgi:hypothetical protein
MGFLVRIGSDFERRCLHFGLADEHDDTVRICGRCTGWRKVIEKNAFSSIMLIGKCHA